MTIWYWMQDIFTKNEKIGFFTNQDSKPEYLQRGTKLSDESEVTHQII